MSYICLIPGFIYRHILGFYVRFNLRLWDSPVTCLRSLPCPSSIIILLICTNFPPVTRRTISPIQVIAIFNIVLSTNSETAASWSVNNISDPLQQVLSPSKQRKGLQLPIPGGTNRNRAAHVWSWNCFFHFPCLYPPPVPFLLPISAIAADQQQKLLNTHKRWKKSNQSRENPIFNIPWFFILLCYLWRTKRRKFCSWSIDFRLGQGSPSSLWTLLIWNDKELINCFPFILLVVLLKRHLYLFPLSLAASPVFSCISNHFWCICSPG